MFGWNFPFEPAACPGAMLDMLEQADVVERDGDLLKSQVRFSSIGDQLFLHSGFPTETHDAVFFGPDTYRFVRALRGVIAQLDDHRPLRVIDVGCGTGAGGLFCARELGSRLAELVLADINPAALRYAAINAALNGIANVDIVQSDGLASVHGDADLIIANPPYLVDAEQRLYRHGGDDGIAVAMQFVREALDRLAPGGLLAVYTGTPVRQGKDCFLEAVRPALDARTLSFTYEEIDADVFGDELDRPAYASVDRIAVVFLVVRKERMR